jgi:hypothetical protein
MKEVKLKDKKVKVIRHGNAAIGITDVGCYTYQIAGSTTLASPGVLPIFENIQPLTPIRILDFVMVPMGQDNSYPEELRAIIDEDNFLPEGLGKNFGLIWGQGPFLYRSKFENGRRTKEFVEDKNIQAWLDSWDYRDYITKATIDFTTVNGHFTKFYRNRGARVGKKAMIAKLEHSGIAYSRLEWPDEFKQVHHIITGNFRNPWNLAYKNGILENYFTLQSYPIFDPTDPFAFPISMRYSNLYNFALDYAYSHAPFHGALNWIKLASSIPKLLSNFNSNSAAIKYHIEVPAEYWESKKSELITNCSNNGTEYNDKMLEDLKDKTFEKITKALSGVEKVGKFVTTEKFFSDIANEYVGWTFTVLDQKVGDFITAQIKIASEAAFQVSAGIGLHPALSNLSKDGNLPSGSEQLYAFKLYLLTAIDIAEIIIMRDINSAIAANFPDSDLQLGFYHDVLLTEAGMSPGHRIKNAGPGGQADPAIPVNQPDMI